MCSTWALAVFGAIDELVAISAFVLPAAISRATSNSRAVSGHHGSSSVPRPRACAAQIVEPASAAARCRGAAPSRSASVQQPTGLDVAVDAQQTSREVELAPRSLPRSDRGPPSRPARVSSRSRAATVCPCARRTRPSACASAGAASHSQSARRLGDMAEPRVRPPRAGAAASDARDAGDDERHEEGPLAAATRERERLLAAMPDRRSLAGRARSRRDPTAAAGSARPPRSAGRSRDARRAARGLGPTSPRPRATKPEGVARASVPPAAAAARPAPCPAIGMASSQSPAAHAQWADVAAITWRQ